MTTINHHLAEQMGIAHVDQDGRCMIANGAAEFDLFGEGRLHDFQRLRFRQWAEANGHGTDADPQNVAVATGYVE